MIYFVQLELVGVLDAAKNPAGRPKAQNIIPNKPGLSGAAAKNATEPLKAFELFFDNTMMQMLISKTNIAIAETRSRVPAATLNSDKKCHFRDTTEIEIRGLIGMMYYRAMMNQSLESVDHLFNEDVGLPALGAAMRLCRFRFLLSHLSLDDKPTRAERWKSDR